MNYYLVEFVDDSVHTQYEEVTAISAQEAVYSIKFGWPNAKIWNVWIDCGENDQWKDE
jgi:hypothetical protein